MRHVNDINELQREILRKIFSGNRMFSYWTPTHFVHVTAYNPQVSIHYTLKFQSGDLIIRYCLTSELDPLPFQPEMTRVLFINMKIDQPCQH